jgi:hypothetical protein
MAKTRLWTALELKVKVNTPPALRFRNYAVSSQMVCMWACLCFANGSQNKQRLFANKELIDWSLIMETLYLGFWTFTEGTWQYYDYFIWCVSCTVVVLTCFVMCWWGVFWQLCECFGNKCTCIYCVLYCVYCVLVLFRLCIFILICFVCTSVKTNATEWKLNCSK